MADEPKNCAHALCPFNDDFHGHMERTKQAMIRIQETNEAIKSIHEHTRHLEKLDDIARVITDLKNTWSAAALGEGRIPISSANFLIKVFGIVIVALAASIGALLTGAHMGLWTLLK